MNAHHNVSSPPTAIKKLSASAPRVAQGTNSPRHERIRSGTISRRPPSRVTEGPPSDRGLTEPRPVACTRLRQKLARPLRSSSRVLSDPVLDRTASVLVAGHTAAPGEVALESGVAAKPGTPVIGSTACCA